MRVLVSFPDTVGKPGIGTTAAQQVRGLAACGVEVTVWCTHLGTSLPSSVRVVQTLTLAGRRIPHRALGSDRAYHLHDRLVSRRLSRRGAHFDVVHCWPRASLHTPRAAAAAGIPAMREVPNTHTAHAFDVVARELDQLGLSLPRGRSHAYDEGRLARELEEYERVSHLLVASDHAKATFVERGVPEAKLVMHRYGCDPSRFNTHGRRPRPPQGGLRALFVGRCEPRKGLHHALRAWIDSGAADRGRFVVCGSFVPGYEEALSELLAHPSVEVRGYVDDPAALMRASDVFLLPSIEEGSALVTYEAQACGCVLLASDAAGARCEHGTNALVHPAGDLARLTADLSALERDPRLLERMAAANMDRAEELSWRQAGVELASAYERAII